MSAADKEFDVTEMNYAYPWTSVPLMANQFTDHGLTDRAITEQRELRHDGYCPDLLMTMYVKQQSHAREYCKPEHAHGELEQPIDPNDFGDWTKRTVHESFRRSMGWAIEEFVEATGLFKGKPWRKQFPLPDRTEVVDEIADGMHFFLEALIVAGITPEELFEAYFKKAKKNDERRASGY